MTTRIFQQVVLVLILTLGFSPLGLAVPTCLGGPSTGFKLGGAVNNPKSFTPAILAEYKTSKMTVTYFSGAAGLVTKTFIGVPLYDLVTEAVVKTDSTRKNDILRKYLVANATDCYQAVVAVAEILPSFGGEQAMVAFATVDATGTIVPLDDTEGAVKLVMPGDKAGGRHIFHLNSILVRSAP